MKPVQILFDTDRDGRHFALQTLVYASIEVRRDNGGDWAMTGAKIFLADFDMSPAAAAVKTGRY